MDMVRLRIDISVKYNDSLSIFLVWFTSPSGRAGEAVALIVCVANVTRVEMTRD